MTRQKTQPTQSETKNNVQRSKLRIKHMVDQIKTQNLVWKKKT